MAQNRFFQWMAFDWPIKVLSVVAAVLLFFFVQFMQMEERTMTFRPEVVIQQSYKVDSAYVSDVELTMRGRPQDISYIQPEDMRVFVDLSGVDHTGLFTVPVLIEKSEIFNRMQDVEITAKPQFLTIYAQQRQSAE